MKRDEKLVLDVAHDILAEWLDGVYFGSPDGDTDWHLKLTDEPGPGQVFVEKETDKHFRIEMRVTKL